MGAAAAGSGGVSLATVLVVIFFVLKVAKVGGFATWSWWLVFLPWIIALGFGILALIGFVLVWRSIKRDFPARRF